MSKSNGNKHLASTERAAFFGESAKTTTQDPDTVDQPRGPLGFAVS
jgi:hypothetical protein